MYKYTPEEYTQAQICDIQQYVQPGQRLPRAWRARKQNTTAVLELKIL